MRKIKQVIYEAIIILAISLTMLGSLYVFKLNIVVGNSMEPTYNVDELLICNRLKKDNFKRGDIIVFYNPKTNSYLIKRIIALEGEKIKIKDNKVYINSSLLIEKYAVYEMNTNDIEEVQVPNNKYFVMGDNRNQSIDSRSDKVSFVDKLNIYGKIEFNLSNIGVTKDNYLIYLLGTGIALILVINSGIYLINIKSSNTNNSKENKNILKMLPVIIESKITRNPNFEAFIARHKIDLNSELNSMRTLDLSLSEKIELVILDYRGESDIKIKNTLIYYNNLGMNLCKTKLKELLLKQEDVLIMDNGSIEKCTADKIEAFNIIMEFIRANDTFDYNEDILRISRGVTDYYRVTKDYKILICNRLGTRVCNANIKHKNGMKKLIKRCDSSCAILWIDFNQLSSVYNLNTEH